MVADVQIVQTILAHYNNGLCFNASMIILSAHDILPNDFLFFLTSK